MKRLVRSSIRRAGYDVVRLPPSVAKDPMLQATSTTWETVAEYTMTSEERIFALCHAVEYVVTSEIPGEIVECGVWKGGSMMAAALTLRAMGTTDRRLNLFDTFDGMSAPGEVDRDFRGAYASDLLASAGPDSSVLARSPLQEVAANIEKTGYPRDLVRFIKGPVEETLPQHAPESIALLRLDTDWYESTRHELEHLYPRLNVGGVLIIDDYGHWAGARKAVDEYVKTRRLKLLLNRIDYTGCIGVKVEG
ncbi:hypothetical protein A5662_07230 [Mycobacteriaceae bacterium 1482268.1]|nr:hypothetical protein A5662_07230 [Mycobacteriaceae bacterium 1482268.1]